MPPPPPALRAGTLLLADPSLHGSYFARTVILITSYDSAEGTQGFILNRPSTAGGPTLGDLLSSPDLAPLYPVPVSEGGPVSGSDMILVGLRWNARTRKLETKAPLGIAAAIAAQEEGWNLRGFLGYSGWTGGQLENELSQSSWLVVPGSPEVLETPAGPELWSTLLRSLEDPRQALLADLPDDPSLN